MDRLADLLKVNDEQSDWKFAFFHFDSDDYVADYMISAFLGETKKSVDLGQGRMVYFHKAHIPGADDHLHFKQKGAHLYSLNKNGTAHDKSHGTRMARWAIEAVKARYSDLSYLRMD